MKLVIVGATGLVGTKVAERLRAAGHELVPASPATGAEALAGAAAVIDVATAPVWEDAAVLDFFERATRTLLAAEAAAGVGHHVALSVVGAGRLADHGFLRAKAAQEAVIRAGNVPYTIVRATPFYEVLGRIADSATDDDTVRLPPIPIRPVAADDVAAALADVATGPPVDGTVELAGPEALRLDELARRVLGANRDRRVVLADPRAPALGCEPLTPNGDTRLGTVCFEDWLRGAG